jgi:hypothetical protein
LEVEPVLDVWVLGPMTPVVVVTIACEVGLAVGKHFLIFLLVHERDVTRSYARPFVVHPLGDILKAGLQLHDILFNLHCLFSLTVHGGQSCILVLRCANLVQKKGAV